MASTESVAGASNAFPLSGSGRIQRFISRNDTDGNGTLSLSEFEQIRQNLPGGSAISSTAAGSSASDADDDAEATSSAAELFGQIDTDGDGQLTASELTAYRQKQITAAQSALLNLQEVFGSGEGAPASRGSHSLGHHHRPVMDADSLADLSELTAATGSSATGTASRSGLDNLFSQLDTDGSGTISRGELSTFLVQAMASVTGATATPSSTTAATATAAPSKTATA